MAVAEDDDLVAFFRAMPEPRRRAYDALAELDRQFGEDVATELRAHTAGDPSKTRGGS